MLNASEYNDNAELMANAQEPNVSKVSEDELKPSKTTGKRKGGRPPKPAIPEGTPPYITAEEVKTLRLALGLSLSEFSRLVRVAHSTVRQHWEIKGVYNRGGDTYSLFNMLCALTSAAAENPDFISPMELLGMIDETLNYTLGNRFMPYAEHVSESFVSTINSGDFSGVVLAVMFDSYLRKKGIVHSVPGGMTPTFNAKAVEGAFSEAQKTRAKKG